MEYKKIDLAKEKNIKTIAFPTISTGVFSFPKELASKIAVNTVRRYVKENPNTFSRISRKISYDGYVYLQFL